MKSSSKKVVKAFEFPIEEIDFDAAVRASKKVAEQLGIKQIKVKPVKKKSA